MRRPNPVKLQKQCDDFNERNPVGTSVKVKMDSGELRLTTTRSRAEVLSGHSAVIWLDGISGCYLLDRVSPAPEKKMVVPPIEHIADLIDDAAPGVLRPDTRLRIASRLRAALSAPEAKG